ncbi:MAG TPA: imidazolonepropionase [Polyangiaceae bacterium]
MSSSRRVLAADRIVTCDPERPSGPGRLGVVEGAAVVIEDGVVVDIVDRRVAGSDAKDFGMRVITPGLVDAHTHAAWTGSRHEEYELKMNGADYRTIAAAGGGIASSHRAVASTSEAALAEELAARLGRMARLGVTTCEVKSGYGLEREHELKQLAAIARASKRSNVPTVVPTFLALHALPPGTADRKAYVRSVEALVDEVAAAPLARFVDAYVDANAFTVDEARVVGERARRRGLGVRLHAGQFADVGAAELAVDLGARSADHLEHVSEAALVKMAEGGVSAGLLPTACFTLKQRPPPIEAMRRAGVSIVVASDANPGTAPTESLPLAMALAVRLYGLTAEEAILGATLHAARSLDVDAGTLRVGGPADFVVWDLPHEKAILQPWGVSKTLVVARAGETIFSAI